jgi:hypothetical protein
MRFYIKKGDTEGLFSELDGLNGELSFEDNFKGFFWTGTLAALEEIQIANKIKDSIPLYFLVIMAQGANNIVKGSDEWTERYVSVKNADSTTTATVTIFFFV